MIAVAISLIGQHIKGVLTSGNGSTKRQPMIKTQPPRRPLMTSSISLPAGNPNLVMTRHERTPPKFIAQGIDLADLDPIKVELLRNYDKPDYQMRPH